MKKMLVVIVMLGFTLSACLPAFTQPQADSSPPPISEADLRATAEILSQQTLQALPTLPPPPSETPVIVTETETPILETATETPNPVLLTLTATLGTGTPAAGEQASESTSDASGNPTGTPNVPLNPLTLTNTPRPLFYGTLPPSLPYGSITLINKAKADAYISLRCVTRDGNVTFLEYPVKKSVTAKAPAGSYTYVAWVGGRQFLGSFSLAKDGELTITLFKDSIAIK
jgi:hypothetical protein